MDFYYLLVYLFADDEPFSYFTALALILTAVFSAYISMNRSGEYIKDPDTDSFKPVKKAAEIAGFVGFFLFQWCVFAALYLLKKVSISKVSTAYIMITVLAAGAVVFTVVSKSKYTKARNIYNSLYLKANKGNLGALMGNPLGLESGEQNALNSILISSSKYVSSTKSDPLNDMLTGAIPIEKSSPVEAAMGNLEQTKGEEFRECPFCKRQVERKYPICVYCGKLIPDRDKDYRNDGLELSGWERADR